MINSNSAFSGTLTAALDVMAFSHEINFIGKNITHKRKSSNTSRTTAGKNNSFQQIKSFGDRTK